MTVYNSHRDFKVIATPPTTRYFQPTPFAGGPAFNCSRFLGSGNLRDAPPYMFELFDIVKKGAAGHVIAC
jgi:hypothetical protein